jgi:hypothetical protein
MVLSCYPHQHSCVSPYYCSLSGLLNFEMRPIDYENEEKEENRHHL